MTRTRATTVCALLLAIASAHLFGARAPRNVSASLRSEVAAVAIDFSHAGFGGGGVRVPDVSVVARVRPTGGDDTASLQAALDRLSARRAAADGFRGALLLTPGRFKVSGQLRLNASGVVLRGSGTGRTTVVATGRGRRTLVEIGGDEEPTLDPPVAVTDETVPAGGRTLTLERVDGLAAGERVVVTRPSTKEWIAALEMNKAEGSFADQRLHWTPGSCDLVWDRIVVSVDTSRRQVTLDAPITTALEKRYAGGTLSKVVAGVPARRVGLEDLTLESEFDPSNPHDEEHSWIAVALDNVEDAWVRRVVARHFAGSAVRAGRRARRVTVEECLGERPVSELGGYRRQTFFVEGQQVLVRACTSEEGLNDFAAGFAAAGPNVFLDCTAARAHGPSGTFESWASGLLYERVRVEGAALRLTRDDVRAQGGGWTAANSVVWNSEATRIETRGHDDAPVLVRTSPQPLYETQLAARCGASIAECGMRIADSRTANLKSEISDFKSGISMTSPSAGSNT
ncbi:MAG TPA: hypothetical protein VGV38_17990, partial [Pyrinomonadaceae bacterium]|nr:hypothetical protein [Pyrinomonadaceae bacterium]